MKQIADAGIRGLVVPDLPLEEANYLLQVTTQVDVELILLVAPTSSEERIEAIAQKSKGFIYLVSVTGVTGVRSELQLRTKDLLIDLKRLSAKPIGVGFGISQPEQARQVKEWGADAVIVGSAFVKQIAADSSELGLQAIGEFCHRLKTAISD
jgi:tryptophan synthase alpha chain